MYDETHLRSVLHGSISHTGSDENAHTMRIKSRLSFMFMCTRNATQSSWVDIFVCVTFQQHVGNIQKLIWVIKKEKKRLIYFY